MIVVGLLFKYSRSQKARTLNYVSFVERCTRDLEMPYLNQPYFLNLKCIGSSRNAKCHICSRKLKGLRRAGMFLMYLCMK